MTQEQFYAALSALELRLGAKIESAAVRMEQRLDSHTAEDRIIADKVLEIQTAMAERAGLGRHWRTLVVPAALLAGWEYTKYRLGWK